MAKNKTRANQFSFGIRNLRVFDWVQVPEYGLSVEYTHHQKWQILYHEETFPDAKNTLYPVMNSA